MRITVSCLWCVLIAGPLVGSQDLRKHRDFAAGQRLHVERFLDASDTPLVSYRAVRQLEAATRNGQMKASLTAITTLDQETGFRYEIVSENGSAIIRSKVLRAALEAERRTRNAHEAGRGALSKGNYDFGPAESLGGGLVSIAIRPRREDVLLIEGRIVLTENEGDLVRIEGRLLKRPSFWTRRVRVSREYARISGVRVPISMESTADVLVVGRSTFSMRYEYEEVNALVPNRLTGVTPTP